jgi:hypothetical protein
MKRRRQFAAERQAASLTAKQVVSPLEIAVEAALKGGYCPACGTRYGRAAREHFPKCGGATR